MKISFIELHFHYDCVDGFCKTFENTDHELVIFTKPWIYERLKHNTYINKYTWYFCKSRRMAPFFQKQRNKINEADLIFIDTMAWEYGAYSNAGFEKLTICRVHNAYKLFDPWHHIRIPISLYYLWKAFSYFGMEMVLRSYWYYRPRLLDQIDYFMFPDEGITDYALSRGYISREKVLPPLPLKVYEDTDAGISPDAEYFRISIIGGIDKRRRDYETVVEACKKLVPALKKRVILTLLGKPKGNYSHKVIGSLKSMESEFFTLEYYKDSVSQVEFDLKLAQTHLILSPIKTETTAEIWGETYGKTKITGSLLDMTRFPKVTVIPSEYKLGADFIDLIDQYKNAEDLKNLLMNYIDNRSKLAIKSELIRSRIRERYSSHTVAESFGKIINDLLNKRRQ